WREVGARFGYQVPERTPFFFYSDHNRFEQTNIVSIGEGTGGVTEAFKNRLLIFNDGSEEWLCHVIPHEFTHVTEFNILYAGLFRSVQLVIKSPFYPLWMMEGMAEYGAGDIDEWTTDMVMRDAVANHQLPDLSELHGFAHLKPDQVTLGYKTGEAAFHFFVDEYGKEKPLALMVAMREHFDISSGLSEAIGADRFDIFRFNFRFHEWMNDKYAAEIAKAKTPADYGPRLTPKDRLPQFNEAPAISPDGTHLYYMSDKDGPTRVFEMDLAEGKAKPLFRINWEEYENLHAEQRALSVSPDGRWLAFAGEKKQRDYLFLYDLHRRRMKKVRLPLEEIRSPTFSPVDSDRLVCVGMDNGYNDLFLIDREGHIVKRLTSTPQDEKSPQFSPDGKRIIFSGEMLAADGSEPVGRDLFWLDLDTLAVTTAVALPGRETEPEVLPDGTIVFVRDRSEDGWRGQDLFSLAPGKSTPERLTRVVGGCFSPRFCAATRRLYFVGYNAGERHIYEGRWSFENVETPTVSDSADIAPEEEAKSTSASQITTALLQFPTGNSSPLYRAPPKPYRFKGSTDVFLPFFVYSTQGGFAAVYYWQFSDLLSNHILQNQVQYASGSDFYDVSAAYTYARFRPQFTIAAQTQRFYTDFDQQEQKHQVDALAAMTYPLNRVDSATIGFGARRTQDRFLDQSFTDEDSEERFVVGALTHDTVTGRYLEAVRGNRLSLFFQQAGRSVGGNQTYKTGGGEADTYFPLPRESTFATRLFYARSTGENAQVFSLGGADRIRAFSDSDENKKTNAVLTSGELRYRLKYLNARTKYLFP
ncbi:MAG: PD40 domain-containing protein, partial [Elusimicrobia bacterium]|nr:PD40 domain-containing protein [Elusimicrobiota bacterium]